MWENCGNFILKQEINLLQPKKILILGNSDNFYFLNQKILDTPVTLQWSEGIGIGEGTVNDKMIELIVVPHPQSRGGNSHKNMINFKNILLKNH